MLASYGREGAPSSHADLTGRLREILQKTQTELDVWTKEQYCVLDGIGDAHYRQMQECARTVVAIRHNEADVQRQAQAGEELERSHAKKLEEMRLQVEELLAKAHGPLPRLLKDLKERKEEHIVELESKRVEASNRHQLKEEELLSLTRGVIFYKALGLEFQRLDNGGDGAFLRMIFTQIDPSDAERAYSFSLCVDTSDRYHVSESQPALPAAAISRMLSKLNHDNDLSYFVRGMRRQFCSMAAAEGVSPEGP
ncbi:unnamed protein product [Chrysoparadoxa australica]